MLASPKARVRNVRKISQTSNLIKQVVTASEEHLAAGSFIDSILIVGRLHMKHIHVM